MNKQLNLTETAREFYLGDEEKLKKSLIRMLINKDGKYGPYKHPKYAERLSKYILKIVPLGEEPETAAISFDEGVVYVNEGFLTDASKFYQLNVIMRHELAHNLLMHQIRMMEKIGSKPFSHIRTSQSIHDLLNIIEDFEISNKKYTSDDKRIILNMWLNGKIIKGLVTEMHRADWMKMSVEQMYDELVKDLERVKSFAVSKRDKEWPSARVKDTDTIDNAAMKTLSYIDRDSMSFIWKPAEEFFKKSKRFHKLNPHFQDLIHKYYSYTAGLAEPELNRLKDEITNSEIMQEVAMNPKNEDLILYTPEEKWLAMQAIKYNLGQAEDKPKVVVTKAEHSKEYVKKYNEIIKKYGKRGVLTAEEVNEIINGITFTGGLGPIDEEGVY